MQELGADSLAPVATVAGNAMRRPLDAHQTFDIEVQPIAWSGMFIAVGP